MVIRSFNAQATIKQLRIYCKNCGVWGNEIILIKIGQGNKQLKLVWKINLKDWFYILKQIKKAGKVEYLC